MNKLNSKLSPPKFIALIIIIGIIVFSNSISGIFVWDDKHLIEKSHEIRNISNIPRFFLNDFWFFSSGSNINKNSGYFRPVIQTSFAIDYFFYELNYKGYHITNIIFHIANGVILFFILLHFKIFSQIVSFFIALIFLIHPLRSEPVAWISGRTDVIALFFLLASILTIIKIKNNFLSIIISFVSMILSLLCKEFGIIIIPILIIFIYQFNNRFENYFRIIGIFLSSIFYLIFRFLILNVNIKTSEKLLFNNVTELSVLKRIPVIIEIIYRYVIDIIIPINLNPDYIYKFSGEYLKIIIIILMMIIILIILFLYRKKKIFLFCTLSFFISVLPVSNIVPLAMIKADRYIYFPSIFVTIIFVMILAKFIKKINYLILFLTIISLMYSIQTIRQNKIWKNEETLFDYILIHNSESSRALMNRGILFYENENYIKGIEYLEKAITYEPRYIDAKMNLGAFYYKQGQREGKKELIYRAFKLYEELYKSGYVSAEMYNNLGLIYTEKKDYFNGAEFFKKALELDKTNVVYINNYAQNLQESGEFEQSIRLYEILGIKTSFAHQMLANRKIIEENFNAGIANLKLLINQNDALIRYRLLAIIEVGTVLIKNNKVLEAREIFEIEKLLNHNEIDLKEKINKLKAEIN